MRWCRDVSRDSITNQNLLRGMFASTFSSWLASIKFYSYHYPVRSPRVPDPAPLRYWEKLGNSATRNKLCRSYLGQRHSRASLHVYCGKREQIEWLWTLFGHFRFASIAQIVLILYKMTRQVNIDESPKCGACTIVQVPQSIPCP